jgi:hypothetical protein
MKPVLQRIKTAFYYSHHRGWPIEPGIFFDRAFTQEELESYKSEFTALYDKRFQRAKWVGAFFLVVTLWALFSGNPSSAIVYLGMGVFVSYLVYWYGRPTRCPCCSKNVDHCIGLFCPCCGSKSLEKGQECFICTQCKGQLKWEHTRGRARRYKLHACSVCGVWLHDEGIW